MTKTIRGRFNRLVDRLTNRDIRPWVLEGEDCSRVENPTSDRIRLQLSRLRAKGPSFLSLSAPDGSYVQAAGSGQRVTVELHRADRDHRNHFVVGHLGDEQDPVYIRSSFGRLEVLGSEVLTRNEAAELFDHFQRVRKVPPRYQLRDISAEIASAA